MEPSESKPPRKRRRLEPPQPKPYHISEPFQERGLWCFWLTADQSVLDFVLHLSCILQAPSNPFQRRLRGRILLSINPRYDHEEAWLWINELLESEAKQIDLQSSWEDAISKAVEKNTPE